MPTVGRHERMLIREMPFAGFYRAVVRYGYMDEVRTRPPTLLRPLIGCWCIGELYVCCCTKLVGCSQAEEALCLQRRQLTPVFVHHVCNVH